MLRQEGGLNAFPSPARPASHSERARFRSIPTVNTVTTD